MYLRDLRKSFEKDDKPIDLIGNMFPIGYVSILASKAGVGKTWYLQKLSCDVSKGGLVEPFGYSQPERKVLYFTGETGIEMLNKRIYLTDWKYKFSNLSVYGLNDALVAGVSLFLDDESGRNNIIEIIRGENPELIIFDTLISFHRQDESAQKEITGIYAFLTSVAKRFDCAILISHHLRKSKLSSAKISQDEVIGTSAMSRLASTVFVVQRLQNTNRNLVKNVKNWLPQVPDFTYEIKNYEDSVEISYSTTVESEVSFLRDKILNYLKGEGLGVFKSSRNIMEDLDFKKKRSTMGYIREICRELENEGKISAICENGKWYYCYGSYSSVGLTADDKNIII